MFGMTQSCRMEGDEASFYQMARRLAWQAGRQAAETSASFDERVSRGAHARGYREHGDVALPWS
jgi:hypothetical protein